MDLGGDQLLLGKQEVLRKLPVPALGVPIILHNIKIDMYAAC